MLACEKSKSDTTGIAKQDELQGNNIHIVKEIATIVYSIAREFGDLNALSDDELRNLEEKIIQGLKDVNDGVEPRIGCKVIPSVGVVRLNYTSAFGRLTPIEEAARGLYVDLLDNRTPPEDDHVLFAPMKKFYNLGESGAPDAMYFWENFPDLLVAEKIDGIMLGARVLPNPNDPNKWVLLTFTRNTMYTEGMELPPGWNEKAIAFAKRGYYILQEAGIGWLDPAVSYTFELTLDDKSDLKTGTVVHYQGRDRLFPLSARETSTGRNYPHTFIKIPKGFEDIFPKPRIYTFDDMSNALKNMRQWKDKEGGVLSHYLPDGGVVRAKVKTLWYLMHHKGASSQPFVSGLQYLNKMLHRGSPEWIKTKIEPSDNGRYTNDDIKRGVNEIFKHIVPHSEGKKPIIWKGLDDEVANAVETILELKRQAASYYEQHGMDYGAAKKALFTDDNVTPEKKHLMATFVDNIAKGKQITISTLLKMLDRVSEQ